MSQMLEPGGASAPSVADVNGAHLTGTVIGAPALKRFTDTRATAGLCVAITGRPAADGSGAQQIKVPVRYYGEHAEAVCREVRAGWWIAVDGRLDYREWPAATGTRSELSVVTSHEPARVASAPCIAADVNGVHFTGMVISGPELRRLTDGTAMARLHVAITGRTAPDGSGAKQIKVPVRYFGERAEAVCREVRGGWRIGVDGRLSYREWPVATGQRSELRVDASHITTIAAAPASRPRLRTAAPSRLTPALTPPQAPSAEPIDPRAEAVLERFGL